MEILTPFEVVIVSLHIGGRRFLDGALFLLSKHELEGFGDALGNFVLNGEDVFHLAVVTLGPDGAGGGGFDETSGDAQTVAGATKAAFENVGGVEFATHFGRGDWLVAVGHDGGTGEHPKAL